MPGKIPLYTHAGVKNALTSIVPFSTEDGLGLTLTRFCRDPQAAQSVLLIHGLTQSSDMFIMPEHDNLVTYLLDNHLGDVWCLDFRMSNHFPYTAAGAACTIDDAALFDHAAAVATVRQHIGDRPLHVICHCLGSMSFHMAMAAGKVTNIASVIGNSVALTPHVTPWALAKLSVAPDLLEYVCSQPYISPRWLQSRGLIGRSFARINSLAHRECDVPACQMLSVMWGSGHPAMYSHEQLHPITHARIGDLHGDASLNYYRHVHKMAVHQRAVKYAEADPRYAALPNDYLACAANIEAPVLLTTGDKNHVFTDSNIIFHSQLEGVAPGKHQLAILPGYGHADVFMGKNAARDVFPQFLRFLRAAGAAADRAHLYAGAESA